MDLALPAEALNWQRRAKAFADNQEGWAIQLQRSRPHHQDAGGRRREITVHQARGSPRPRWFSRLSGSPFSRLLLLRPLSIMCRRRGRRAAC